MCLPPPPGSAWFPTSERSAARLAHRSGGPGVGSSNLPAPTTFSRHSRSNKTQTATGLQPKPQKAKPINQITDSNAPIRCQPLSRNALMGTALHSAPSTWACFSHLSTPSMAFAAAASAPPIRCPRRFAMNLGHMASRYPARAIEYGTMKPEMTKKTSTPSQPKAPAGRTMLTSWK